MMDPLRTVTARWTFEGWHRWPEAKGGRHYLSSRHRHLFHAEVEVRVRHNDREVEFHDLLAVARSTVLLAGNEFGRASCEDIAEAIHDHVYERWPRPMRVSVFEDNEVGATLTWEA